MCSYDSTVGGFVLDYLILKHHSTAKLCVHAKSLVPLAPPYWEADPIAQLFQAASQWRLHPHHLEGTDSYPHPQPKS